FSTLTSLSNYTPGIWQHVYFAIDNSVLSLYLNGILQGTTMAMPNFSYDTNAKVLLGSSKFSFGSAPFIGYMDNVKFYNRILAPAEVAQLYSQDPNCISVTQPPISGFSTSPPCINTPISFFDTSLPGVDFWEWSVTSGTVSDPYVPNPNFTASTASDYTITLISENDFGSDTISQAIHLNPLPQMSVTCSPMNFICQWDTVTFIMNGNATTYTASIKNLSTPSMGTFSCAGISTCSWPPNHYMGTYLLRASGTNSYGCLGQSDSLYVKVNVCEHLPDAIDENELNEFVGIYPNPGKKIIMVKKPFALCKYDLIDITGATVLNGELKEGPKAIIDLGEKPPGIYFLQINADGKTITRKIVKSD
ncbi:MAG: T9SS type A sorting domain-containing protein, partial [Bacteroidia bacterium]|nr:T9SS type A sorting domain-containing protein [Bacteroidia bacterium]